MANGTPISPYGYATIDPKDDIVAGSYGTWRLTYVVGAKGIATGGRLRISTDADTDWALPQFEDPRADDYATFQAPAGTQVAALTQGYGNVLLVVMGRGLKPGEKVVVTYGDRSGGSRGSRAQTSLEREHAFRVAVAAAAEGHFTPIPEPPIVAIVGGPAARLLALAPSTVGVGQPFRLLVQAQDAWGNPSSSHGATIELSAPGVQFPELRHTYSPRDDQGVWILEGCRCEKAGVQRIKVTEVGGALKTESNPIVCSETAPARSLYWGDPHGGQLHMAAKIPEFFGYARIAAVFCSSI